METREELVILVVYCLRNMSFTTAPYGLCELLACAGVVAVHKWKNNMYLSIIAGTVIYMALIRFL